MELTKICTKCKKELPATAEYFYRTKNAKCGLNTWCKKCCKSYLKEYYPNYRLNNKEKETERHIKYYEKNKEKIQRYAKEWGIKNRKKIAERSKEWKKNNPEKIRFSNIKGHKKYKKKYPERKRLSDHKYRISKLGKKSHNNIMKKRYAINKNLNFEFTGKDWERCLKYFENKCAYCGKNLEKVTLDHFIPIMKNGEYSRWNLIPSCKPCNSSKGIKDFFDWYIDQNFYSDLREKRILKYLSYSKNKTQKLNLFNEVI